jgi:uncharacterized protein YbjT (DUF2867 family)
MTHSEAPAGRLPPGVDLVTGDLDRPETLRPAFSGMEAVFLMAPSGEAETARALSGVAAAREAGVRRVVYLSAIRSHGSDTIPLVASKIPVEVALRTSPLRCTILRPNHFFQNDLTLRDVIVGRGVYPQPLGSRGLNRVDLRDLAEAAVNAIVGEVDGEFPLNGPRGLTGDDTARVYSEALGRPVRYAGDDLDAWAREAAAVLPAWKVRDSRLAFEHVIRNGVHASGRDFLAQERLLGHAPRSFEAFVAELGWS